MTPSIPGRTGRARTPLEGVAVVRDEWHLLLLGMFAMTWFSFLDR